MSVLSPLRCVSTATRSRGLRASRGLRGVEAFMNSSCRLFNMSAESIYSKEAIDWLTRNSSDQWTRGRGGGGVQCTAGSITGLMDFNLLNSIKQTDRFHWRTQYGGSRSACILCVLLNENEVKLILINVYLPMFYKLSHHYIRRSTVAKVV